MFDGSRDNRVKLSFYKINHYFYFEKNLSKKFRSPISETEKLFFFLNREKL